MATTPCDLLIFNIGQLVTNADAPRYGQRPATDDEANTEGEANANTDGAADTDGPDGPDGGELELELDDSLGPRFGEALGWLGLLDDAAIAIADGEVIAVGHSDRLQSRFEAQHAIDAGRRLVTPGLIDPHTHPVFARHRADEFELRIQGVSYEEIAGRGGGILNSARRLRELPEAELLAHTRGVFDRFLQHGTTTIEAKSGYGLTTASELASLRVIRALADTHPLEAAPTFLGAHEVPPEFRDGAIKKRDEYLDLVINEMLPRVQAEGLAEYIDVFCERGVFSAAQAERVLRAGIAAGLAARIHTDEFADVGGTATAAAVGARTADHLHVTTHAGIKALMDGGVMPVLLPGVPFFLGQRDTAPAREMIRAGLPIVLATDYNPGSAHIISQPFIMSLACLHLGLTPAEALVACTVNAAFSIDRGDRLGRLLPGFDADVVIWDAAEYQELAYNVAINSARDVFKAGAPVVGEHARDLH
ncbi:MAG: imidazolonepropionase [Planctomycetota bacterium]